ncbi:MAG: hypothetical protein K9M97_14210 [Akkermansiaceae bacterium]|nr:hypothetical protein [Akkermansiaceae bacterium]
MDTESPVLDEKRLTEIEAWVRRGGVFITTGETGRHTPEKADAWPIDSLTGYTVDHITRHPDQEKVEFAGDQPVFTVPAAWQDGEIKLWVKNWIHDAVRGRLHAWLDGQPIAEGSSVTALDLTLQLKPGSSHLLALEFKSEGQVAGCIGNAWLSYLPRPLQRLDLTGNWTPSHDGLAWGEPAGLPGPWTDWSMARRKVAVPAGWSGMAAMIEVETETQFGIVGVMVNGRLVRRLHHEVGTVTRLNVTPWIRCGQENEIHIVRGSAGSGVIKRIGLDFFPPEISP